MIYFIYCFLPFPFFVYQAVENNRANIKDIEIKLLFAPN